MPWACSDSIRAYFQQAGVLSGHVINQTKVLEN